MIKNKKVIIALVLIIILALVLLKMRHGGTMDRFGQRDTVTVVGESSSKQKNKIASFTAGVNVINDKKEDAVNEANKKMNDLVDSVKSFGISSDDIKTQNMSVYQQQDQTVYSPLSSGQQATKKNQWVVNNTLEITLRDVSKAQDLANLLNKSGANNVYGPNFTVEENSSNGNDLFGSAIDDAKEKAQIIAKSAGRKLGKVVNVVETNNGIMPVYKTMSIDSVGAGAVAEPGTSTISKTLTVVFELK
jgi:uncharacterized protein YggE